MMLRGSCVVPLPVAKISPSSFHSVPDFRRCAAWNFFKNGEVVEASATRGRDFLMTKLGTDEGARKVGEVAFGLNPHVDKFTGNTLFDEKMNGTMHLALGKSLPLTGGRNASAIHWDMVTDLRHGEVYADGQLCYKNGKFVGLSGCAVDRACSVAGV